MFNRKEYRKRYYQENKEKIREQRKRYYQENKERCKEYCKKHPWRDKEEISKYNKRWREDNKEHIREWRGKNTYKEFYWKNKEKILEHSRIYLKTEKGKAASQRGQSKRRARLKEIVNTLTAEDWLNILERHNFKCSYCGKELSDSFNRPERDHILPISKGGNNTNDNIVPACRSCNARKGNRIMV